MSVESWIVVYIKVHMTGFLASPCRMVVGTTPCRLPWRIVRPMGSRVVIAAPYGIRVDGLKQPTMLVPSYKRLVVEESVDVTELSVTRYISDKPYVPK